MTTSNNTQYIIRGKLGEGGMGTVYLAEDTALERMVAIKELNRSTAPVSEPFGNRFQQEALALARLNHPNITHLYAFLPNEDTYWMVMEYVQGKTLEEWMNLNRRISPLVACSIMVQILDGLHHAHRKGIIHRDLKPANVMISDEGEVKVMDFGIARIRNSQRITQQGKSVGTLEYMSPEQIQGKEGDERTDIYASGNILYELLSGQPPFRADTDYHLMKAKLEETPKLLAPLVSLPPALQKAIFKSLERVPAKRFDSVIAFKEELERIYPLGLLEEQQLVLALGEPMAEENTDTENPRPFTIKKWSDKLSLPSLNFLNNIKFDPKRISANFQMIKSINLRQLKNLDIRKVRNIAIANSTWILVGVILLCGSLLLWNYFSGSTPGIADDIKGGGIVNGKDSTKPEIPGTKEKNSYIIENTLSNNTPVNNPRVDEEKKDDPNEKPGKKKESPPTKKKDGEKPDDKTDTPVEPEPEPIKDKKETPSESKGPVDVPAGREIYMTLAETISSEETGRDGSIVRLYASEDIRAGNRTIIRKGAAITGKIVDVIPSSTKRRKALIGFVVMKVEAVDGSTVKLHSERFRLFSDNAGSPAIYKQGQQFSAKLGRGRID